MRFVKVEASGNDFVLLDAGSRNGVAVSVRGERAVKVGQRVLMGDQILRVESI